MSGKGTCQDCTWFMVPEGCNVERDSDVCLINKKPRDVLDDEERLIFVGINLNKPVVNVKHKDLKRYGDSIFKSMCPECHRGLLLVSRDPKSLKLTRNDHCFLCGQHYYYTDLEYIGEEIEGEKKDELRGRC